MNRANDGFDCGEEEPATLASRQQHSELLLLREEKNPTGAGWNLSKTTKLFCFLFGQTDLNAVIIVQR